MGCTGRNTVRDAGRDSRRNDEVPRTGAIQLLVCPAVWFKRATLTGSLAAEPIQEGLCSPVATRTGAER
jgi:hypothetical protein